MISAEEIVRRIQEAIPGARATVQDIGGGNHWSAVVVAEAFDGVSLVEQHKMVYAPLKNAMADQSIHALKLKTMTPAQAGQ